MEKRTAGGGPRARALGALALLLAAPLEAQATPRPALDSCSAFTSHEAIGELLAGHAARRPDIARTFTAGHSVQGRALWGLVVSASPELGGPEPGVRILGAIHGDECMAAEIVLAVAAWLVDGHGVDPFLTRLIDLTEVVLVPLVNPDGYSTPAATRENARGVDLNRNFGFAWVAGSHASGPEPWSEPESRAIRDLSSARGFALGLTYHTEASYVNGPWNYTPHHPPDAALVQTMGEAYAGASGYTAVFGWDWFAIFGDVNDWSLGTRGTLDWTLELRRDRSLEWEVHEAALRRFLAFALVGVRGTVTDAATGEPLAARIEVEPEGAPVFTDPDSGAYHRVLLPGVYSVRAVAGGFEPRTVAGVVVPAEGVVTVDLALERGDPGAPEPAFAVEGMTLPEEVGPIYRRVPYRNRTRVFEALGPPDGRFYSMSPGGSITLELSRGALDGDGPDIRVVSGTGSVDPVAVLAAADRDGPFVEVGGGTGDLELDLAGSGLLLARYVRLVDRGSGPFNDEAAGYDLDAVLALSPPPLPELPPPPETDGDADADLDADARPDADPGEPVVDADAPPAADARRDADDEVRRPGRACGCRAAGGRRGAPARLLAAVGPLRSGR